MANMPLPNESHLPEEQFETVVRNTNASGALPVVSPAGTAHLPGLIGRYRILSLLGQGGMGAVYKAEQDQPRRLVALKVIRAAIAAPDLIRRFEIEGEALGRLHHPGIAQIFEAGKVDTGAGFQPYFAMELIDGQPLTEYAAAKKLHLRQRLALIIRICEAIEHAHQRGIIHRDLKPSNILVDETGQPKILDFGLARLSDEDSGVSRQTDMGQLLGTLAYMSPEQVRADPAAIDARTDVYAIGMILYELLAEKLPYQLTRHLPEVMQTIQMAEPGRLSKVNSAYRGDIETIAAKALEKDKTRRYSTAAELAADIRRYLDDEPIVARPASKVYQLQKFARRNKAFVAGTVAVFVALSCGVVASLAQAARARKAELAAIQQRDQVLVAERRASAERDRALAAEASAKEERDRAVTAETRAEQEKTRAEQEKSAALLEKQRANAINDFLQNDLLAQASSIAQSDEDTEPDPDLKVRTALDRAAARIPGKFQGQPEVEAAVRETLGKTYLDLGRFQEASAQLEKVFEYSRRTRGPNNTGTLEAELQLAGALRRDGRFPRAGLLFREVLDTRRQMLGPEHPDTMRALTGLAVLLDSSGKQAEAEGLLQQGYETLKRALGPEHPDTLAAMTNLADVYRNEAKYSKAEALFVQVLEARQRLLGPAHPSTLDSMNHVAAIKRSLGDYAGAEELHREVLTIKTRVLGPEHPDTLSSMNSLAGAYNRQKKYAQAEALHRQTYEIRRRVLGPEHPSTLQSMNNLANSYESQGKWAQSAPLYEQVVAARRKVLGPEHPKTLRSMHNFASSYSRQGLYAEALAFLEQVLAAQRRLSGPEHPDTLSSMDDLAELYKLLGRTAEAEALYHQVLEAEGRVFGPDHPRTKATKRALEAVSVRQRTN